MGVPPPSRAFAEPPEPTASGFSFVGRTEGRSSFAGAEEAEASFESRFGSSAESTVSEDAGSDDAVHAACSARARSALVERELTPAWSERLARQ